MPIRLRAILFLGAVISLLPCIASAQVQQAANAPHVIRMRVLTWVDPSHKPTLHGATWASLTSTGEWQIDPGQGVSEVKFQLSDVKDGERDTPPGCNSDSDQSGHSAMVRSFKRKVACK